MRTRATTEEIDRATGDAPAGSAASDEPAPGWWQRLGARLQGDYEEDGTFRPVRLSPWADVLISLGIVAFMAACFVGFFVWLAMTQ